MMDQLFLLVIKWQVRVYKTANKHTEIFKECKNYIKGFIVTLDEITKHNHIVLYLFKKNGVPTTFTQVNNKYQQAYNIEIISITKLDNPQDELKDTITKLKDTIIELKDTII